MILRALAGVFEVIKKAPQPILGVCGGHQQIALAFGAPVDLMARLEPGEGYRRRQTRARLLPNRDRWQRHLQKPAAKDHGLAFAL